jgi:hypothetical protein
MSRMKEKGIYIGFRICSERSIRSRHPDRCRSLGHVVWNDSVWIVHSSSLPGIQQVRHFPSLTPFSVGVVGFTTLQSVSTVAKEFRIYLAWSCLDANNCLCKPVRSGSIVGAIVLLCPVAVLLRLAPRTRNRSEVFLFYPATRTSSH